MILRYCYVSDGLTGILFKNVPRPTILSRHKTPFPSISELQLSSLHGTVLA